MQGKESDTCYPCDMEHGEDTVLVLGRFAQVVADGPGDPEREQYARYERERERDPDEGHVRESSTCPSS